MVVAEVMGVPQAVVPREFMWVVGGCLLARRHCPGRLSCAEYSLQLMCSAESADALLEEHSLCSFYLRYR
jgi:hypothetical protein